MKNMLEDSKLVYFMQVGGSGGPIKIGKSSVSRVFRRLFTIQISNYQEVVLLGCIFSEDVTLENRLHQKFSRFWIRGEWFTASRPLLRFIERRAVFVKRIKKARPNLKLTMRPGSYQQYNIRMPKEQLRRIREVANRLKITVSELIRFGADYVIQEGSVAEEYGT